MNRHHIIPESQKIFETIFHDSPEGIILLDIGTKRIILCNSTFIRMFEYTEKDMSGFHIRKIHPVPVLETVNAYLNFPEKGRKHTLRDIPAMTKNGNRLYVDITAVPFRADDSSGILIFYRDVTEQKKNEPALRHSEDRLRHVLKITNNGFFDWNMENGSLFLSPECYTMLGYESDEFPASYDAWFGLIHPEDREKTEAVISGYRRKKRTSHQIEFRLKTKSGGWKWILNRAQSTEYNSRGTPVRIMGTQTDISKSKRAEDGLNIQHDLFLSMGYTSNLDDALKNVLEASIRLEEIDSGGVYLVDKNTGKLTLRAHLGLGTTFIRNVMDYEPGSSNAGMVRKGQPVYTSIRDLPPGMRNPLEKEGLCTLAVIPVMYENQSIAALNLASHSSCDISRETRNILESMAAHIGGAIVRLETENALKESEERYRTISSITSDIAYAFQVEANGTLTTRWVAGAYERITGFTMEELDAAGGWFHLVHHDDRPLVKAHIQTQLTGQPDTVEFRIITKNGDIHWLRDYASPVWDRARKRVTMTIGAAQDITEQKQAEIALQKSEEKFRSLAEESPNMIFINNFHKLVYVNKKCTEIMGYTRDKYYSDNFDFFGIIAPEYRDIMKTNFGRHKRGEEIGSVEYVIVTREGRHIDAILTTRLIDYEGSPAILGIITDITGQKQAERQIQKDLEEKNILLKEIYHRVKNNLSVISSLLHLQAGQIRTKQQAVDAFKESRDRIYAMALVHEKLYNSGNLSQIDMRAYLEAMTRELSNAYGFGKSITIHINVKNVYLNIHTAIPCGLILNEIVTNAFKHAFPEERHGRIDIKFYSRSHGIYHLIVRDNGIGLPENIDIRLSSSMGLKLVWILTQQLEGDLGVIRKNGTQFEITFKTSND